MSTAEEILRIFQHRGSSAYFGEAVSMTEHALQTAHFARLDGAPANLVVAALLHDVGHLIEAVPEDIADWKSDAEHEVVGSLWLAARFGPQICEPVRLHVPAKRYLCAMDPAYLSRLSSASVATLSLQGGPMSASERAQFEKEPYAQDALRLRLWDDQGKVAGLSTASLDEYRQLVQTVAAC